MQLGVTYGLSPRSLRRGGTRSGVINATTATTAVPVPRLEKKETGESAAAVAAATKEEVPLPDALKTSASLSIMDDDDNLPPAPPPVAR